MSKERIGLVAGAGKLPIVFADEAKKKGVTVIGFGIRKMTSPDLEKHVDRMHWFDWGHYQKAVFALLTERIRRIILLGKVQKDLFLGSKDQFDAEAKGILGAITDKTDYSILRGVDAAMRKVGIEVVSAADYMGDLMPSKGLVTARAPSEKEAKEIALGQTVAKELARFDIGQTVCVKDGCVIALEGVEGTDETIRRAGVLCGGNFSVVKMARPDQDMRFDVPMVGLDTIATVIGAGGTAVALQSGKTILIEREELLEEANRKGISISII